MQRWPERERQRDREERNGGSRRNETRNGRERERNWLKQRMRKERGRGPELERECGCEDPLQGSGGGGAAGSSRGSFRCTPYQPAARCSDPMPMSEKSIVPGQGRGQREPQLQCGEGGRGTAKDLLALLPLPHGSRGWTTW